MANAKAKVKMKIKGEDQRGEMGQCRAGVRYQMNK